MDEYDTENEFQIQPLNEAYKKYYDTLTTIVLGSYNTSEQETEEQYEENDSELFEVKLEK